MSRYIDQDQIAELARHSTIGIDANDIMRFPSIEIIHCKDCKHYEKMSSDSGSCFYWQIHQLANGFCECGIPRETEAEE